MKRVLIVDDDVLVRRYLSQLIDWKANGFELLEPSRDGAQALEQIRQYQPDIVLTDIDMPVMNGIDLLMQIRSELYSPHVVVLSCHDDFAYVRESMRLGAEEYFLKDEVTGEKLLELLRQLTADSPDAQDTESDAEERERSAGSRRADEAVNNEELLRMIQGTSAGNGLIRPDAVAAVHVIDYEEKSIYQSLDRREQFYHSFARLCEEKAEDCAKIRVFHVSGGWFAALFEFSDGTGRQEQQYHLQRNANIFQYEAQRQFEISLRIGVMEMQDCQSDIHNCWEAAKDLTGHAFYSRRSVFFGWQTARMGTELPPKAQAFLDVASEMRAKRDRDAVQQACRSVFREFEKACTKESVVISWLRSADRLFQAEMQPAPGHFAGLEDRIALYVSACEERLPDTESYSEGVSSVIRFIQKHYAENISLNDAADEAHLTTTYLSYVFHKETGITFSEYLQSCRISRAKDLLDHTQEKVREIGKMVGYHDNRHFSKTFKKVEGMTPQDYRKRKTSKS